MILKRFLLKPQQSMVHSFHGQHKETYQKITATRIICGRKGALGRNGNYKKTMTFILRIIESPWLLSVSFPITLNTANLHLFFQEGRLSTRRGRDKGSKAKLNVICNYFFVEEVQKVQSRLLVTVNDSGVKGRRKCPDIS